MSRSSAQPTYSTGMVVGRVLRIRTAHIPQPQAQQPTQQHAYSTRPARDRKAPEFYSSMAYDYKPHKSRGSASTGSGGSGHSQPEVHHKYSTRGNKSVSLVNDLSIGGLGVRPGELPVDRDGDEEDEDAVGSDESPSKPVMYDPPSHPPPDIVDADRGADGGSYEMKEEAIDKATNDQLTVANGDTIPTESPYVESPVSDEIAPPGRRNLRKRNKRVVESDYEVMSDSQSSSPQGNRRSVSRRAKTSREMRDFVTHSNDEDDDMMGEEDGDFRPQRSSRLQEKERRRREQENLAKRRLREGATIAAVPNGNKRLTRNSMRHLQDGSYVASFNDQGKPMTSREVELHGGRVEELDAEEETEEDEENFDASNLPSDEGGQPGKKYRLRKKKEVNYVIPGLPAVGLDASFEPKNRKAFKKQANGRRRNNGKSIFDGLPMNMSGKQYDTLFGIAAPRGLRDDSDDDLFPSPRKPSIFAGAAGVAGAGQGIFSSGFELGSAPNNLGKVENISNLADTDPLAPSVPPSFESVGGLQDHIQRLKEMVTLPLLYPEVFHQFKITPPRGVLFHGPPGTGKTLMARALAASCTGSNGQKISFFMRKGADCLSKWVGEAERGLRLLFEEARNSQPSIIFFDEIDGLAPVRSSKQEQIHASIVSTLLALMDGMDGRGQVIVIGATNRPDAIDPALRRPGRFDREFYFPLPNREARRAIIDIHTKGWEPPLDDTFKNELVQMTKGYGGADLRALCTEAALNAVQRTYPQVYKTVDRLQIDPSTIKVTARDFFISQKTLIPSTARASSSVSAPLPEQMEPLLKAPFERAKTALAKVLPDVKKVNLLEEAEYEDEPDGGFERENFRQTFEKLRIFRPRLLICGEPGMGQNYISAAVLHHLEGYHVQSLDLGVLVSDSTRTPEAACVQLFMEAKRHKPSIICIPALISWSHSVTETVRATIKGLLDGLEPSDPILLLGILDGHFVDLPSDIKTWFGFVKGNRLLLNTPSETERELFFEDLFAALRRTPIEYPDAFPRKKRILEELPLAPPPPPRVPTEAEIHAQQQNDARLREYLKWKLGPVLTELKKRYKKFMKPIADESAFVATDGSLGPVVTTGDPPEDASVQEPTMIRRFNNIDLEQMHYKLYYDQYLTVEDFFTDIVHIRENAELDGDTEYILKAGQMHNHANIMLDQTFELQFRSECQKMAVRERKRMEERREKEKAEEQNDRPQLKSIGSRYGTRANGAAEIIAFDDITAVERKLKRQRATDSETSDSYPSKKAKSSNNEISGGALAQAQRDESDTHERVDLSLSIEPDAAEQEDVSVAVSTPAPATHTPAHSSMSISNLLNPSSTPPPPEISNVNKLASVSTPVPLTSAENTIPKTPIANHSTSVIMPIISSSPPPAPSKNLTPVSLIAMHVDPPRDPTPISLPDFILDEAKVQTLKSFLTKQTHGLNVDQLEELRSMCYSCVWQGRSQWNRNGVLDELAETVAGFIQDAESI